MNCRKAIAEPDAEGCPSGWVKPALTSWAWKTSAEVSIARLHSSVASLWQKRFQTVEVPLLGSASH